MTILGKILVFVNLIFSLVTGALVIMVYVTQNNWVDGFDKLKKNYQVAEANSRMYAQEVEETKAKCNSDMRTFQAQVRAAQQEVAAAKQNLEAKTAELSQIDARSRLTNNNVSEATEELNRVKLERDRLKEVVKQKEEKMVTMESQNTRWRNDAITADITAKSEQERNRQLLDQLAALTKELERRQTPGAGSASPHVTSYGQRPPADDVEGTVLETDAKSDLVTISIGSDSGVNKGNTLVVYRLKPRPEYVGTLSVIDSQPREAVARPIKPLRAGPVQKGDIVASRVLATGRQ
jgi:hypothetical protein